MAVVQRPGRLQQAPQVPVGGKPGLPVVEVEVPGGQGGGVFLPRQDAHFHRDASSGPALRQVLGDGLFKAVLLVDQQGQRPFGHIAALRQGGGEGLQGTALLQVRRIQGGNRGYRKRAGPAMAGEVGAGHVGPVNPRRQAPAEGGAVQGRPGSVTAHILQHGGFRVHTAHAASGAHRRHPREVRRNQLDLVGGKAVEHGVVVRRFHQGNPVHRLALPLPPGLIGDKIGPGFLLRVEIGPRTDGSRALLGPGFHDGHVQQGRKGGVGAVQRNGHTVPVGADGSDAGEAAPVAVGGPGPLQGRFHIPARQGRSVGELHSGAELEGIAEGGLVVGIADAQAGLGLEAPVQPKQSLIQKRPRRLLHPVGAVHWVQGPPRHIGQGEPLRQDRILLLLRLFRLKGGHHVLRLLRGLLLPAARQQTGHRQRDGHNLR